MDRGVGSIGVTGRGGGLRLAVVVLAGALVLLAGAASAGPRGGPPGKPGRPGPAPIEAVLDRHGDRLGLDEDTRREITRLSAESRARSDELDRDLRSLHRQMREFLGSEAPDEDEVMALARRIGEVENEAYRLRLRTLLRIREQLTPEQRAALVEIEREQRTRRHHEVTEACAEEIAAYCSEASPGRDMMECLKRRRDALSPECRAASRPPHHRPRGR